ncbi:Stemmadenine O-acetyltransferase [Linum perenne]
MKLEVRVVSKEIITPSHPTPNNLRRYSLSFLDQISPPVYNPLVLFYTTTTNNDTNAQRSKLLKESLSKVLSLYYPLAGCIDETNSFAFCNDEGVPYVETEVNSQISLESKKVPSRIETLSVFIWSRLVKVTRSESRTNRSLLLLHAVNLRTRMDPPLPEHSFGNYYRVAVTVPNNDDAEEEEDKCGSLISLMRESISKVDKGFVKSLQGGGNDEHFNFIRQQSEAFMKGEAEFLNFTSLCRFPRYESDFGWGKPSWVGTPCLTFKNLVVFMDSAADGIEALIHLDEAEMGKFQQDQVLLQYAS